MTEHTRRGIWRIDWRGETMDGAKGSRLMRLLKGTSEHHRPSCLAAAVAFGMLVGLVPKANLLAAFLFAALLLLPIHTVLALVVCLGMTAIAWRFDPLTHSIGDGLLRQPGLRPLWVTLDQSPILPWLGLNNTVVLGSLLLGVGMLAPTYLISLRAFERWTWSRALSLKPTAVRKLARGHRNSAQRFELAPAPAAEPQELAAAASVALGDAPEDFDPVREVTPIINQWHMGAAAKNRRRLQTADSRSDSRPRSASVTSSAINPPAQGSGPRPRRDFLESPPPRRTAEISNSLELAQSASDVLAWVDELLNECLVDESATKFAENLFEVTSAPEASAAVSEAEVVQFDTAVAAEGDQPQWLLETTIEVVRWADGPSPSEAVAESGPRTAQADDRETLASAQSDALAQPEPGPVIHSIARREAEDQNNAAHFEHLVMADRTSRPGDRKVASTEVPRGECLGYLLGHLRQTRDGRSS